jgi:DNA recombination protein RmuC
MKITGGERMAEDVLQLAGFIENINYQKQRVVETGTSRPDFTFFLPQGLKVNMDVKFPLNNYLKYLESKLENEREHYKDQFIRDVKQRVKEVTTRDYINPIDNTLDYVLVFIPNEQVYSFVNEHAREILDEALKNKVILCSPFTLYAVLAVIRQSIENFSLQKTSGEMLSLFGNFYKQWNEFNKSFEKVGKKLEETQEEFFRLTTTRRNQLDRLQ